MHGGISFDYTDGDLYADIKVGADTVRKKLGNSSFDIVETIIMNNTRTTDINTSEYKQIVVFSYYSSAGNSGLSPNWSQIISASNCKKINLGNVYVSGRLSASCYILIADNNTDTCTITFDMPVNGSIYLIE